MKEDVTELEAEIEQMEEYIEELKEECSPKKAKLNEKKCYDFFKQLTGNRRNTAFIQLKNLVAPKVIIRYKFEMKRHCIISGKQTNVCS